MNVFESFRAVRWIRTLNLVLQAVLVVTLFGGLNYIAKNHPHRFDLTRQRKFSLSPETLSYIKNLQRPVHIVMAVGDDGENPEAKGLLDEFVYATEDRPAGRITKETVDLYQQRKRSEELGVEASNILVLVSGDKRRVLPLNEFYAFKDGKAVAFRGEQVLTAAILDVSEPAQKRIYFVVGHGEFRVSDTDPTRGLSAVRDNLKLRNFNVDEIDLTAARAIPDDAALLIAVAPQGRFSRAEQEMLRTYLSARAGRLMLFIGPRANIGALGLDELLLDWGILVYDDEIYDTGAENIAENGDLILYAFNEKHPITKMLLDHRQNLRLGRARTVIPDPGRALGAGLDTEALAATSPTAWGERDFRPGVPPKYDPGVDTRPIKGMRPEDRLGVIVASERLGVRGNLPFSVRGGKMVVFGTNDMIANARFEPGNFMVFLNAVNWAVDRDPQLNVPPRPLERFQISLSAADFSRLRYALLLVLPGGALLLGLLVYWTRRT